MRWQVQLLGGFMARRGDVTHDRLPTKYCLLLLARLLLESRRAHSRDELALWLWPGIDPRADRLSDDETEIRRKRLRQALSLLKAALDLPETPTTIIANGDTLRVNADAFDLDVRQLEACVAAGDRAGAFACYRGPLLPGLNDEWLDDQRARIDGLLARLDVDDASAAPIADTPRVLVPYVTRFIGREAEMREITARVAALRLVVINGPGGCGKSRLSAHVAEAMPGFDAVHYIALADCTLAQQIEDRIGTALHLRPGGMPMFAQIEALLAPKAVLLVIDNFEQLAGAAGEAVLTRLLERLPRMHLLVSSRRALACPDAHNLVLEPLPLPAQDCDAATALRNPAVALFVDRAGAARVGFRVHQRNVAAVVRICRALDGLPLAIELAASRVRDYRVGEIGQALTSSLHVLAKRGPRAVQAGRHASMALSLDWSWQLLDDAQRQALVALSVFREGFTVAQADEVVQGPDERALAALLRDSLVHLHGTAEDASRQRLRLLASVREFVGERAEPALLTLMRERHRAHFGRMARRLQRAQSVAEEADLPNVVAAMESGLADGDATGAVALALALQHHWSARGAPADAASALARIVEHAPADTARLFELVCSLPRLLAHSGQMDEARKLAERALATAGEAPPRRAAALLAILSVRWMAERDAPALIAQATEALQLARAASVPTLHARAAWLLGAITLYSGAHDAQSALALFEESEHVAGADGDRRSALLARSGRIGALVHQRRWAPALELIGQAQAEAEQLQDLVSQLQICSRQSTALEGMRRFAEALEVCRRHVRLAAPNGLTYELAYALWNQCRPRARVRQPELAGRLMAFSRRYWIETFGPLEAADERHVAGVRRLVAHQVGTAQEAQLWSEGLALTLAAAVALAS